MIIDKLYYHLFFIMKYATAINAINVKKTYPIISPKPFKGLPLVHLIIKAINPMANNILIIVFRPLFSFSPF